MKPQRLNLKTQIEELLKNISNDFEPQLSYSIDISDYSKKIFSNAYIITHFNQGILIGFLAFYCNDETHKTGYLSMLAIEKPHRGQGIARAMMEASKNILKKKKFLKFRLEVYKTNRVALEFYKKNDFQIIQETGVSYIMEAQLTSRIDIA